MVKNNLPIGSDYTADELMQVALRDKKRAGNDITLIIPQRIGGCECRKIPVGELRGIIAAGLEE